MADLSSCFTSQEEEKRESAFAGMSRDSLETLILQLAIEIYRRSLTAKKDDEGPVLENPEDLTPVGRPKVMLSGEDVFKSSMPKDSWPSSPTDSLESQKLVVKFLKQNYGAMKTSISDIKVRVFQNQLSMPTLNLMDVELTFCLENMKTLRHLLIELPHLKTSDKYKIHTSYHSYEDMVRRTKQVIQELLLESRQRRIDLIQNTQFATVSGKKQEEVPAQIYHYKLLSETLSKKHERKRYNAECQRNAEMRHRSEVEKLLKDQNQRFEIRLRHELAKKEAELRTHQRCCPPRNCHYPPAQVNDTRLKQVEYRITLTPEQFTIWIEMQREFLMSRIQTQTQASKNSTENTFQESSQQINIAKSNASHHPERSLETEVDSVTQPKYKDLVCSEEVCEIPEEKSVLLFSEEDVDENSATNADQDGSRKDILNCLAAGKPNQGLCTHLNLAPNVEEEAVQQEENQVFERIQTVSERSTKELKPSVSAMFV